MAKFLRLLCTSFVLISASALQAQQGDDDLLSMIDDEPQTNYAAYAFKTNRIVNGHSIENLAEGVLDFKISHRFGALRNGFYDVFGLDAATIRIGLDYGVTDWLMIGVGRSSKEKIIDGYVKARILRQSSGKKVMPLSLSYLTDAQIVTARFADPERENLFSSRLYYTHQLLLARKFNETFTLQLMPTLVHRNLTRSIADRNDVVAMGVGGRIRLSKRVTLNAEYYHVLPNQIANPDFVNVLSVGFDIETGGHVFQLHFTNSPDMTYKGFITETSEAWFFRNDEGRVLSGLRFGFNISRVFTVKKPKGWEG